MNEITVVDKDADWHRPKSLVLDFVSSPITKRVYNLGLDEFFEWYGQESRLGFTKATVAAWLVALEVRGLGAVSINVRITAVRKLAVEAADNGLLAPELANGITRVKGVPSKGVSLGNWLTAKQAQALLNAPDTTTIKGFGIGPSLPSCWAVASGARRWRRLGSSTSSSATAAGASSTSSASTVVSAQCPCRRGLRWRSTPGPRPLGSLMARYSGPSTAAVKSARPPFPRR